MATLGWIVLWLCQVALSLMFLGAGVRKFTGPMWARMFARWGYPDHFYLVIGAIEVIGALGLLVPRTAAPSAVALIVVMIGAGFTHALHDESHRLVQIAMMTIMLAAVVYGRWADATRRKSPA